MLIRSWQLVPAALLAAGASMRQPARAAPARVAVVFSGPAFDGRYAVRVVMSSGDEDGREKVHDAIARELALAARLFSLANPGSELSRLNAHASVAPFRVSRETIALLEVARRASELTGGAFDATAAPLTLAWGLRPKSRAPVRPGPDAIAAARARVGYRLLQLDTRHRAVTKSRPDVVCDLSGLVPGWAADRIARAIVGLGYRSVLVDLGGEVTARGRRADGRRWHVALDPTGAGGASRGPVLELEDASVATSGEYGRLWTDAAGHERSLVLDPRTGEPAGDPLGAASVVHRDGAWADALARAFLVLGPHASRALASREHLAARFVERRRDGTFAAQGTPELEPFLVP